MSADLLPVNSSDFERAVAEAIEFPLAIDEAVTDLHGVKYHRPLNTSVGPYLIQEYGLGPISEYFETYEDLIDAGRVWQRLRGTPAALSTAMAWIDYESITIEDQVTRRRRWHLYQIEMGEVPAPSAEIQRLWDAAYLAGISDPARSEFFRGYHDYDVRGLEWSRRRWGDTLWGDSSGVRIAGNPVKWSHGREIAVNAIAEDGKAEELGVDFENGAPVHWNDGFTWQTSGLTWYGFASAGVLKFDGLKDRPAFLGFYDGNDAAIGFATVLWPLIPASIDGDLGTVDIELKLRTRFGDGDAAVVSKMAIVFDLEHDQPAGRRWINPENVTEDGIRVGLTAIDYQFMRTSRDLITFTLKI